MPNLANPEICTGCMACMNACSKDAITFRQDDEGFLQPIVEESKCVECHNCERSCPEVQQQYHQNESEADVYAGWNNKDRRISSSGGAFSSIARYVLSKGGVVMGATLDDSLECKHIWVDSVEDLSKLRGSKYIQSAVGMTFRTVKQYLLAGRYVLFAGTPCQVSGLYSYLRKDYPKLITMDLICHGVPSNSLFKAYIEKLKNRLGFAENEKVANYEFRCRDGWGESPSISTAMSNCNKLYGINALYMSAFDKASIFRKSCYQCHYAKTFRVGDFSIGDFWGLGHQGIPFKHDMTKGVSLLIVNTEKGREIMRDLDDENFYEKRTMNEASARNHNLTKTSLLPNDRDEVIRAFIDPNLCLDEIEKKYKIMDKSMKRKLSDLSSQLGIYDFLKKLHHLIN